MNDLTEAAGTQEGLLRAAPTVSRALAVLDLFDAEHPTWSAEGICGALGCSVPTGYRYIRELVAVGLLRRISGGFALGPRIILLDYVMCQADPLLHAATPVMIDLARQTSCDCVLSAAYGEQILDVHRERGPSPAILGYGRGRPRPRFLGAAPKMIVAAQPLSWLRKLYDNHSEEAAMAGMGNDWPSFRSNVAAIRKRGYHVSRGELEMNLFAIAAPLATSPAEAPAAIAVVTTAERFALLNEMLLIKMVRQAAERINLALEGNKESVSRP